MTTAAAGSPGAGPGFRPLTVLGVDRLCPDAVAIRFETPPGTTFRFRPGQFLTVRRLLDGVEHRRSYSICSAAGEGLRIGVREIPGGALSGWLVHEVTPGTRVDALPPSGRFGAGLRPGRHLFVAAGSGITPVLSLVSTVLPDPASRVTLLYGNRRTGTIMFAEELADLKDRYPDRLQLVHVLSREPRDVALFSGRLDPGRLRRLLRALVPVAALDGVWLCGPHRLVTGARRVLAGLGVPVGRVHAELFHLGVPPPRLRRPDPAPAGGSSEVTVVLDGRRSTVACSRSVPLLDGAQAVRADLPFACRGGVCGTCRARVTSGRVDLRRNFALDPAEVADGFVLTCSAYPLSEQVTVDYDA